MTEPQKIKHVEKRKVNRSAPNKDKKGVKTTKRELFLLLDGATFGQVITTLGSARFDVFCFDDGITRRCSVRNSKNTKAIKSGNIVQVGLRDYQDDKADIIYMYNTDEVTELRNRGLITKMIIDNFGMDDIQEEDIGFDFDSI